MSITIDTYRIVTVGKRVSIWDLSDKNPRLVGAFNSLREAMAVVRARGNI
jgi:hypothetical protein